MAHFYQEVIKTTQSTNTNTNLAREKKSQIFKQNSHKKSNVHDHRTTQTMKRNQQNNKRHQN